MNRDHLDRSWAEVILTAAVGLFLCGLLIAMLLRMIGGCR